MFSAFQGVLVRNLLSVFFRHSAVRARRAVRSSETRGDERCREGSASGRLRT